MSEKSITFNPTPEALTALIAQLRNVAYSIPAERWYDRNGDTIPDNCCTQAADALENLAADRARLDWLDNEKKRRVNIDTSLWHMPVRPLLNDILNPHIGGTARTAIDAAQKGDK